MEASLGMTQLQLYTATHNHYQDKQAWMYNITCKLLWIKLSNDQILMQIQLSSFKSNLTLDA